MAQKFLNGVHISGTTQLDFMPDHESEGIIKLGRYDSNTSRYHNIKSYVSSTEASNYLKFSLHNGTANTTSGVMDLYANQVLFHKNLQAYGYIQAHGRLYLREHVQVMNKDADGFLSLATRDVTGTEAVYNISNVGTLTANSIIKSGGSSTEFLKADGSVDTNTYLTSSTGASASHEHSAGDITSGTLNKDRIPNFLEEKYIYTSNDSNAVYMPMVKGGMYATTTSTITGQLLIKLPRYKTASMSQFYVDFYDYSAGETMTFKISGYHYNDTGATWHNCSVVNLSDDLDRDFTVRFGADTTNEFQYVTIGETNSTWNYPQVNIRDWYSGYDHSETDAGIVNNVGWNLSFVTTTPGTVHHTFTGNYPASEWDRIDSTPTTLAGYGITDAAASNHNHDGDYIQDGGTTAISNINTIGTESIKHRWNNTTTGRPASSQANEYGTITTLTYDSLWASQLAWDMYGGNLYGRTLDVSNDSGDWKRFALSTEIPTDFVSAANGGTFSGNLTINPGATSTSVLNLTRDTTGDDTIVGDIKFNTTAAESTDDRIGIIRVNTQGGDATTRGGKILLYTRQSGSSNFNTTTYDKNGDWTFPGEIEASTLDINGAADINGTLSMGGQILMNNHDLKFSGTDPGDIVWLNGDGDEVHRIWSGTNDYLTYRNDAGTAYALLHEGIIGNYALPLSGGTLTGTLSGVDASFTGNVVANNTQKSYVFSGGDQDKFYPLILSSALSSPSNTHHFTLTQGSQGGSDPYNFNSLLGYARGQGWSDMQSAYDLTHSRYDDNERNILGVYRGTKQSYDKIIIYVRGGEEWYLTTNSTAILYNGSSQDGVTTTVGYENSTTNYTSAAVKSADGSDVSGQSFSSAHLGSMLNLQESGEGRYMSDDLTVDGNLFLDNVDTNTESTVVGLVLNSTSNEVEKRTLGSLAFSSDTIPSLTGYATESYVDNAVSDLVDGAPEALDTLNELAAALDDNADVLDGFILKSGGTFSGDVQFDEQIHLGDIQSFSLPSQGTKAKILNLTAGTLCKIHLTSSENSYVQPIDLEIFYKGASGVKPQIKRLNNFTWHTHSNDIRFTSDTSGNIYAEKVSYSTARTIKIKRIEKTQGTVTSYDGTTTATGGGSEEAKSTQVGDLQVNNGAYFNSNVHFEGSNTEAVITGNTSGNLTLDNNTGTIAFQANGSTVNSMIISSTLVDINENTDISGSLKLANKWSSSDLTNNSFYVQNTDDGFAMGIGTAISTWFSWASGVGQKRAIDVYNDGTEIQLGYGGHNTKVWQNLNVVKNITAQSISLNGGDTNYHHGLKYQWRQSNSGNDGDVWRKVCEVSLGTANWQAVSMEITHYYPGSNHGASASLIKRYYTASFRRSGGTLNSYNDAILYGPSTSHIRIQKTGTGVYELQARSLNDNVSHSIEAIQTGGVQSAITWENSITAGSTSGSTIEAQTTSNTQVELAGALKVQGRGTFTERVFIGDQSTQESTSPPAAELHVHKISSGSGVAFGDESQVIISTGASDTGAQGYQGSLWFGTSDYPAAGTSTSNQFSWRCAGIASTSGSSDTGGSSAVGNLEFYTNDGAGSGTKRMQINSNGTIEYYQGVFDYNNGTSLRGNTTFQFLTLGNGAQKVQAYGIQLSGSYAGSIPNQGILFGTTETIEYDSANNLSTSANMKYPSGRGVVLGSKYTEAALNLPYFTNAVSNLAVDISLGNAQFNGHLELRVLGGYSNLNVTGDLSYKWHFGWNTGTQGGASGIWSAPVLVESTNRGPIAGKIHVSNPFWDSATGVYKIRVYHNVNNGNGFKVLLKSFSMDKANELLANVSVGSLLTSTSTTDRTAHGKYISGTLTQGGSVIYDKVYSTLDNTGNVVASLAAASNGNSAYFSFECGGGNGSTFQRIVYNCWNQGGNWYSSKDIDEGADRYDVVASSDGSSTMTFTFKKRTTGTVSYTPRVHVEGRGTGVENTY